MNDFVLAGIAMTAIVIYMFSMIALYMKIGSTFEYDEVVWIYTDIIVTLICVLFVLGGVPYIIMGWLISRAVLVGVAVYAEFKK